jgi:hypothetical protein
MTTDKGLMFFNRKPSSVIVFASEYGCGHEKWIYRSAPLRFQMKVPKPWLTYFI